MEFSTEVKEISVWLWDDSKEFNYGVITVNWNCDVEMREWGIKSIGAYVTTIRGYIEILHLDKDGEIIKEEEIDVNELGFDIESELELEDGFLCPSDIDIDFKDKTITIK